MKKQIVGLAYLALVSLPLNAAILDLGLITRDTDTRLDWLDVSQTNGMSVESVTSQMGMEGAYYGWRYATPDELDTLLINFGYVAQTQGCEFQVVHCDSNVPKSDAVVENIVAVLGATYTSSTWSGIAGILDSNFIGESSPFFSSSDLDLAQIGFSSTEIIVNTIDLNIPVSLGCCDIGSFLVAPSPVPIPGAGILFLTALGMMRVKKSLV